VLEVLVACSGECHGGRRPDVAAIAPRWYALTLQCENRSACKHATMKLAAQPALFVELRRDDTRQLPSSPTARNAR